jgi:two-component system invasion response regulator UvrY
MRKRLIIPKQERHHMLVVEDGIKVGEVLSDFLRFWFPEYQIEHVATGEIAAQKAAEMIYRVILMDIGLPGINGIEATRKIKSFDPEVAIVMVTIHDSPEYRVDADAAGADAFILKEKMYAELVPAIHSLLNGWTDASKTELSE